MKHSPSLLNNADRNRNPVNSLKYYCFCPSKPLNLFLPKNHTETTLTSYRTNNGIPIIIWLTTSGVGVRIAAIIKLTRIAYLRYLLRSPTETRPALDRKTIITGISKITPKAMRSRVAREKYSLTAGKEAKNSLLYPTKNLNAGGKTTR